MVQLYVFEIYQTLDQDFLGLHGSDVHCHYTRGRCWNYFGKGRIGTDFMDEVSLLLASSQTPRYLLSQCH